MLPEANEPVPSPLSYMDGAGRVYLTSDRVLRAVPPSAAAMVRALMASGLPQELSDAGLMPPSRISDYVLPGSALVIEHPRLPVVSYPYEWSYGMLRDAALLVLEVNAMANARGYELQDCHAYNVVFDGPRPLYVDFGSLVPRPLGARGWPALEEFLGSYDYPLRIWADGSEFIARRLVAASEFMSHADYGIYRWPWLRWGGAKSYQVWRKRWFRFRSLSRIPESKIRERLPSPLGNLVCTMQRKGWLPAQDAGFPSLRRKVLRRRRYGEGGVWSDYQNDTAFAATPRLRRVIDLVRQAGVASVLELGGNQGRLSAELLRQGVVRQAVCTDAEERAIDRAYTRTRQQGGRLHTAVLDFINPMTSPFGESPACRLKADAVLALAVTHHILLTQRVPVDRLLRSVAAFSRAHVFIEFMPRGLWDGRRAPPVPDWYTLDWFRKTFSQQFDLRHEELLEENRHLFHGRLRQPE